MVAHLIGLRFALLANTFRRSPAQLVAVILGALYGLGLLALAIAGLVALRFAETEVAQTVVVLAGSLTVLGWTLLPLLRFGLDQTVDPQRLARYPIRTDTLIAGLTASGVLGVAGLVTALAALTTTVTWSRTVPAALAALVGAVLATLTCVIASRTVVAVASGRSSRQGRERRGLLLFIPLILAGPLVFGLSRLVADTLDVWPRIARVLAWTPVGAAWALGGDVAAGEWLTASAHLLIALATLVVLVLVWRVLLARALETPARETSSGTVHAGLGLFARMPGTPAGAVAARALTYWLRDPRYAQSLVIIPVIPVLLGFYGSLNGNLGLLIATGPATGLLLGQAISADVSYDNTAFALHLQKGVRGRDDRLGRVIAALTFSLPATIVFAIGSVAFLQDWRALPGVLGVSVGMLLAGFAASSVVSALLVTPVPAPGESPFKAKPGGGLATGLLNIVMIGAIAVLSSPTIVLAILAVTTDALWLGWLALVVGMVLGAVLLVIGIRLGGRILDARGPELLVQLQKQK